MSSFSSPPEGLAAAVLLIGNGDIMGASGIVNSLFIDAFENLALSSKVQSQSSKKSTNDSSSYGKNNWQLFFIVAFGLSANIIEFVSHTGIVERFITYRELDTFPSYGADDTYVSVLGYIISGFLTGFGTKVSTRTVVQQIQTPILLLLSLFPSSCCQRRRK